ncbi:MAG: RNA polymerase sporulation sigma factor SigH [Defluviitaleaceae bacterium]|nr:RNA polymerase sporulation sigma factor SigH [Defluviitaleaceae bacterium]
MSDESLIVKINNGDKHALDVLLNRYKNLARAKAKAYYVVGGDPEDLIQEGMIGLYKAVLDFDAEKNNNFASFASLCIVRQLQTAIKVAGRQKHIPLNESLSLDNIELGESYMDKLPDPAINDPEALFLGRESLHDAKAFIKKSLSTLEYNVLTLHMDGKTHAEIAATLEKSLKSIDNALQRIRKKLHPLHALHIVGQALYSPRRTRL